MDHARQPSRTVLKSVTGLSFVLELADIFCEQRTIARVQKIKQWWLFQDLTITNKSFVANTMAVAKWQTQMNLRSILKPVNWSTWGFGFGGGMSSAVVNSFYNPVENPINILAGILQQPLFAASYPRSINLVVQVLTLNTCFTRLSWQKFANKCLK